MKICYKIFAISAMIVPFAIGTADAADLLTPDESLIGAMCEGAYWAAPGDCRCKGGSKCNSSCCTTQVGGNDFDDNKVTEIECMTESECLKAKQSSILAAECVKTGSCYMLNYTAGGSSDPDPEPEVNCTIQTDASGNISCCVANCPTGYYDSEDICKDGIGDGYKCAKATASEASGYTTGCYKRVAKTCADYGESATNTDSSGQRSYCYMYHGSTYGYVVVPNTRALGNSTATCYGCEPATCSDYWYDYLGAKISMTGIYSYTGRKNSDRYVSRTWGCANSQEVTVRSGSSDMICLCCGQCPTSTTTCTKGVSVTFNGSYVNRSVICPDGSSAGVSYNKYTCGTGGTVTINVTCSGTGGCGINVSGPGHSGSSPSGAGYSINNACGDYVVNRTSNS